MRTLSATIVRRGSPSMSSSVYQGSAPSRVEEAAGWPVDGDQRVADNYLGALLDGLRPSILVEVRRGEAGIEGVDPHLRKGAAYFIVSMFSAALDEA